MTTTKKKGRELNAPPREAPRSALCREHAKPRPMGACWRLGLCTVKILGFLVRP